jgi:hypothetical protein
MMSVGGADSYEAPMMGVNEVGRGLPFDNVQYGETKSIAQVTPPGFQGLGNGNDQAVAIDTAMPIAPQPIPSNITPPATESKIVRTASLDILVRDTDAAADGIRAVSDKYEGTRGNENFSQYSQDLKRGTMSIWVPSEHFDEAVRDIKALALRVDNESITAEDVSTQFVDMTARLKNLKATESQYQELLKRSGSINDILNVTQHLSQVRQQIEQLQGQLDQLSGQVALSAITVSITPEASVTSPGQVVSEWRPGTVFKNAYRQLQNRLMQAGNELIVFVVVELPLLIIALVQLAFWVLVIWLLYRIGRHFYRRIHASHTTPGNDHTS